jgi:6-pyruvoyltetrahydropterin/6-carboxytetrahydropterin synthase
MRRPGSLSNISGSGRGEEGNISENKTGMFMNAANKKVAVFRKEHFNAAHRIFNPAWDDQKNAEVFGKCSNPNFHGHNYELIVKVTGVPDPETGYVIDMKLLSRITKEEVLEKFDHRNLNLDTEYFRDLNPTAEHIAMVIYDLMRARIDPALELQVRLYETERNFVEYPV